MDSKPDPILQRQAINAALSFNWEEAVNLNKQIIKDSPNDVDCLNRLARAMFELGKYPQAKKLYQEVLDIDPYNSIAIKNLKKVSSFKKANGHLNVKSANHIMISPSLFLEEPGITTVVSLVKLAEPQKLSLLSPGMEVTLVIKNHKICVIDFDDNYLGVLPDDISHLLIKLINGGNKYQTLIKSVKSNSLAILIREVLRSKRFRNQPSFIAESKATIYSSDHISLASIDSESSESSDLEEPLM